jgi:hypothetical protein
MSLIRLAPVSAFVVSMLAVSQTWAGCERIDSALERGDWPAAEQLVSSSDPDQAVDLACLQRLAESYYAAGRIQEATERVRTGLTLAHPRNDGETYYRFLYLKLRLRLEPEAADRDLRDLRLAQPELAALLETQAESNSYPSRTPDEQSDGKDEDPGNNTPASGSNRVSSNDESDPQSTPTPVLEKPPSPVPSDMLAGLHDRLNAENKPSVGDLDELIDFGEYLDDRYGLTAAEQAAISLAKAARICLAAMKDTGGVPQVCLAFLNQDDWENAPFGTMLSGLRNRIRIQQKQALITSKVRLAALKQYLRYGERIMTWDLFQRQLHELGSGEDFINAETLADIRQTAKMLAQAHSLAKSGNVVQAAVIVQSLPEPQVGALGLREQITCPAWLIGLEGRASAVSGERGSLQWYQAVMEAVADPDGLANCDTRSHVLERWLDEHLEAYRDELLAAAKAMRTRNDLENAAKLLYQALTNIDLPFAPEQRQNLLDALQALSPSS